MSSTCTALIVPARLSQPVRAETLDARLPTLQALVEGNIEAITRGDWHAYLNDEGKILSLPPNIRAGHLIRETGLYLTDVFCGTVVFLGHGDHGDEADAPDYLIGLAEELFDTCLPPSTTVAFVGLIRGPGSGVLGPGVGVFGASVSVPVCGLGRGS
jgi:Domain of unknown function (DUF3846)